MLAGLVLLKQSGRWYNHGSKHTGHRKSIIGKCNSETTFGAGTEEHFSTLAYFAYDQEQWRLERSVGTRRRSRTIQARSVGA